jgi:hypothetical protein
MNATILLVYCILLLPPLCFCINCPLERVDPRTPHSSHLTSTDFSADRQYLGGGEVWGQRDGLPCPHATSWKGDRQSWRGKGEGGEA